MAYTLNKSTNYPAGVAAPGTTVVPGGDSGSITTIAQPGGAAKKLTDTTQQSATTAKVDGTVPGVGNCTNGSGKGTGNQVPTYGPAGNSLGYSIQGS